MHIPLPRLCGWALVAEGVRIDVGVGLVARLIEIWVLVTHHLLTRKRIGSHLLHSVEVATHLHVGVWVSGWLAWIALHVAHDVVQAAKNIVGIDLFLRGLLRRLLLLLLHLLVEHHLLLDALGHSLLHVLGHHIGLVAHK